MVRIRRIPPREVTDLHRRMEEVMENLLHGPQVVVSARGWVPRADIRETPDAILVTLEIPGVGREEIDITIEGSYLHVAGVRLEPAAEGCVRWHQLEVSYGPFERIINLPHEADMDRITATCKDGFLSITIPRAAPTSRQVPISGT
jgi:HSP20 family protein